MTDEKINVLQARYGRLGARIPQLLLPARKVDLTRWAVVACDQFTSQRGYWEAVEKQVGDAPSMLRLIYPEAYLEEGDDRVPQIQQAMRDALAQGIFAPPCTGLMLVERETESGRRLGLVLAVDLEAYDFTPGAHSLIRATEGTILSRIPPRVRIRTGAALESPHVMLLLDDPHRTVIEPLYALRDTMTCRYDFELMQGGGHLRGFAVEDETLLENTAAALEGLRNAGGASPLLFAVGDGNHSLATARQCWLNLRDGLSAQERATHPARYALAEVCNLHDPALQFAPIHRMLFGVTDVPFLEAFSAWCAAHNAQLTDTRADARDQVLTVLCGASKKTWYVRHAPYELPVATLQAFLDAWIPTHGGIQIDYIHGDAALAQLAAAPHCCGIALEALKKQALFPAITKDGVLPRKTFSMGEAHEKRYYLECRALER